MTETAMLPEELVDIFDNYLAYKYCRDQAIKSIWSYRRASYYGKRAIQENRLFWKRLSEVYPEFADKNLSYNWETKLLTIHEES